MPVERLRPKTQRSWTAREIRKVWALKNKGRSNREIGLVIGRTAAAVHYIVGRTYDHWENI